jgi:hypothetical protein
MGYINKRPMELKDLENLRIFIKEKKKFITQYRMNSIKNKDERSFLNIKEYCKIELPNSIKNIRDILDVLDNSNGICEMDGCENKKKRDSNRWYLRKFCSRKCADLHFSICQKGDNNSFHNISEEKRKDMGRKISKKISKKISNGEFTPNITNSWANSKIRVNIKGRIKFVRSSWEAYFYILNPDLLYELIRIPYFDSKKGLFRNYITDFCDPVNKIIYEIKPKSKIQDSSEKINSAKEWCRINSYEYRVIQQEWIIENYKRDLLIDQPEGERISHLIEKMIKYEN